MLLRALGASLLVASCSAALDGADAGVDRDAGARVDAAMHDGGSDAGELRDAAVVPVDASGTTLALGAAAIAQRTYASGPPTGTLSTGPVATQDLSTVLISIARGTWSSAPDAPRDSRGNDYRLVGTTHNYADWPNSATGLYEAMGIAGAPDDVFEMSWGDIGGTGDEVTISAVEVRGSVSLEDTSWVERPGSSMPAITSDPVTVSGPSILVAWWWGSGGVLPVGTMHTAVPQDGFTLIPEATGLVSLSESGYVQVAVAYRIVDAGTYTVTWMTGGEGAQLYLAALRG